MPSKSDAPGDGEMSRDHAANQTRNFGGQLLDLNANGGGDGRLPLSTAVPPTILLSLSCWALMLTVGLWLARIAR